MASNGQNHWDKEVDVIVAGFGAAGGVSAITAHDAGARVLLIEKMPNPGGISILSGGGVAFARNAEGAFQYLKRTCNGTTPDDILRTMAEEMVGTPVKKEGLEDLLWAMTMLPEFQLIY